MSPPERNEFVDAAAQRAGIEPGSMLDGALYDALFGYEDIKDHYDWEGGFRALFDDQLSIPGAVRLMTTLRRLPSIRTKSGPAPGGMSRLMAVLRKRSAPATESASVWDEDRMLWRRTTFVASDLASTINILRGRAKKMGPLILHLDPGTASNDDIAEILAFMSRLYLAVGGSGIEFRAAGLSRMRVVQPEPEA